VPILTLLVLDASGSMLVRRRISLARAVAKSIIKNSYVKRDSLSLIVFKGLSASTVVKPTRMYSKVLNVLEDIEFGGKTPLTSALKEIRNVTKTFRIKNRKSSVRAILITDGKANVSTSKYRNIREEIVEELEKLLKENIKMEVYDTRQKFDPAPSFTDLMEKLGVCVRRVESPHYGSNIFKPLSLTSSSKSL
jgi:magnesium chelatase subunit D